MQLKTIVFTIPPQGDAGFEAACAEAGHRAVGVLKAADFLQYPGADLYIDTVFTGEIIPGCRPLLVHAPACTFSQWPFASMPDGRFCAWPGFWERDLWEIVPQAGSALALEPVIAAMGKKVCVAPDIAGLIAPRVLCTLINEAAYTLVEGIASATDIDTAMKLGTNYPRGPVEWARAIGVQQVRQLLQAMAAEHPRYTPHPQLTELETAAYA